MPSERETRSYLTHVREVDLVLTFPQVDAVVVHTQNLIRVKLGSLNKFSALDKTKIRSTTHDAEMGLQLEQQQQQQQLATSSSSTMGQSLSISSSKRELKLFLRSHLPSWRTKGQATCWRSTSAGGPENRCPAADGHMTGLRGCYSSG